MKLTPKQILFCNTYVETGNASEAYRRAYVTDSMKADTIKVKASQMLDKDNIRITIKKLQDDLQKRSDISKDEAVKELSAIVRARISDVVQAKGLSVKIKDLDELPDMVRSCIKSVRKSKGGISIELYDKISAIDRLSKMLGWDRPAEIIANFSPFDGWTDEQLEKYISESVEFLDELKK